jgi:hypothetical protein
MLDELEVNHNYLLYVADAELTHWTRRCLGQSDRVLLLATPDQNPEPGEVEQWLNRFDVPIRSELVLWHPPQTERPQNTAVWLDQRQLHAHHHIRQETAGHMERLARRLTGHAIGLVLKETTKNRGLPLVRVIFGRPVDAPLFDTSHSVQDLLTGSTICPRFLVVSSIGGLLQSVGRVTAPPTVINPFLGTATGSERPLQIILLVYWYLGVLNRLPILDFTGATAAAVAEAVPSYYLSAAPLLVGLTFWFRRR